MATREEALREAREQRAKASERIQAVTRQASRARLGRAAKGKEGASKDQRRIWADNEIVILRAELANARAEIKQLLIKQLLTEDPRLTKPSRRVASTECPICAARRRAKAVAQAKWRRGKRKTPSPRAVSR
jgi:hypothetical protein